MNNSKEATELMTTPLYIPGSFPAPLAARLLGREEAWLRAQQLPSRGRVHRRYLRTNLEEALGHEITAEEYEVARTRWQRRKAIYKASKARAKAQARGGPAGEPPRDTPPDT
jgi:hypothetical protein